VRLLHARQVCSAVGMLEEIKAGQSNYVTPDLRGQPELTGDETRERMSGNLCRRGAYANILTAIQEAAAP
jgi:xanthine dehydrogenase YagT iron-sulfur-binding subunit